MQEIYDAYNDGIVDPTAIHAFLADAYETWPLPLLHVQLIGRGTYDYKDIFKAGDNLLPVIMAPTYHGLFAADNRFADVVGEDGVPEFALSRLPVISVAEVMTYLNKLKAYEQASADGPHGVLMVADNPEPGALFDADSDAVAANLPEELDVSRVYHDPAAGTATTLASIVAALNNGPAVMNYIGHGAVGQLADEGLLRVSDVSSLRNTGRLPIFTTFTCAVGNSSYPAFDSLSEAMLLEPATGIIAAFAPTALSRNDQALILNQMLFEHLFAAPDVTIGEAAQAALADLADQGGDRYMLDTYNLFGDSSVMLRR